MIVLGKAKLASNTAVLELSFILVGEGGFKTWLMSYCSADVVFIIGGIYHGPGN